MDGCWPQSSLVDVSSKMRREATCMEHDGCSAVNMLVHAIGQAALGT